MLMQRTFSTPQELVDFVVGTPLARGTAGNNTAASTSFEDLTTDAFAEVSVGDVIHVSGEAGPFTVATKTDNNHLVLGAAIANAHSANGIWRAVKPNGIGLAAMVGSPQTTAMGPWVLFFDRTTFG